MFSLWLWFNNTIIEGNGIGIDILLASKCNQVQYEENEPKSENEKSSGVPNPNRTEL